MKIIASALLCFATASAIAQPLPFTGFYMKGAAGASNGKFDTSQDFIANFPTFPIEVLLPTHSDLSGNSITGLIGIGYSYQFQNHAVLGLSLDAGYTNIQVSQKAVFDLSTSGTVVNLLGNFRSKLSNDFALLLRPGYVLHEHTQIYGLIGPRWGNFQSKAGVEFILVGTGFAVDTAADNAVFGYELGFTAGVGIVQAINERLRLGLEYAYTDYGHINSPQVNKDIIFGNPVGNLTDEPSISVNTSSVLLTLSYQW
jgi:opacity protein-like surface antigen